MKTSKLILALLCWAGVLPAMESKKELSIYEQAMQLIKLTKVLQTKQRAIEHNQNNPQQLPDEILDNIVQNLIDNIAHAQSEEELQESIQAIARFQTTCQRFNCLLQGEEYQKKLKANLQAALKNPKIPSELYSALDFKSFGFICNALIKSDIEDKPMSDNSTFLHVAALKGLHNVVKNLLDTNAAHIDLPIKSFGVWQGFTPLTLAIIHNHAATVRVLIEAHADLNQKGNYQLTPLMFASAHGCTQIVELLIKAHADISLKNEHGKTALDLAKKEGHTEIIQLLESAMTKQVEQSARN